VRRWISLGRIEKHRMIGDRFTYVDADQIAELRYQRDMREEPGVERRRPTLFDEPEEGQRAAGPPPEPEPPEEPGGWRRQR